jgi:hypothetical protein
MNPTQPLAALLQQLPPWLRSSLYTIVVIAGAALAVLSTLGVRDLGPLTLAQALEAYAVLSAGTGGIAVANVGAPEAHTEAAGEYSQFDEDADLSSFEPVGLVTDVYGEVPA